MKDKEKKMDKLIEFAKDQCEIFPEDSDMGLFLREVIKILETKSIPLERIKEGREEIASKYDDFANSFCEREQGRNEMIEEALEILDKLIESEV